MAKIEKKKFASISLQFSKKKLIQNRKKTFCYGVELLFFFDLSPNTTMYAQRLLSGYLSQ